MFYAGDPGNPDAAMVYRVDGKGNMIIEHTEVGEALKGMNMGFQLVQASVMYAREKGIRILPRCPFARSVFEKKPEFSDVYIRH